MTNLVGKYYLQLKTMAIDKYKLIKTFQLKILAMCQHHVNDHFEPF
jgi:hypothetical protein